MIQPLELNVYNGHTCKQSHIVTICWIRSEANSILVIKNHSSSYYYYYSSHLDLTMGTTITKIKKSKQRFSSTNRRERRKNSKGGVPRCVKLHQDKGILFDEAGEIGCIQHYDIYVRSFHRNLRFGCTHLNITQNKKCNDDYPSRQLHQRMLPSHPRLSY